LPLELAKLSIIIYIQEIFISAPNHVKAAEENVLFTVLLDSTFSGVQG
jgi:hypothetical protein